MLPPLFMDVEPHHMVCHRHLISAYCAALIGDWNLGRC